MFSKDFHSSQEAIMRDETLDCEVRVLAWLKRYSWGNYSLHAVLDDRFGRPALQVDCARQLNLDPSRLSHVIARLEKRGYIQRDGRLLLPVIAPAIPGPEKIGPSRNFGEFLEWWKVAESETFHALEVARAEVEKLGKLKLSAYKKWRASQTNAVPSLYERQRVNTEDDSAPQELGLEGNESSSSVSSELPTTPPVSPEKRLPSIDGAAHVLAVMNEYVDADLEAARQMIAMCRKNAPGASLIEICQKIHMKGPLARRGKNPVGLLLTAVAACFEGWQPSSDASSSELSEEEKARLAEEADAMLARFNSES
jgi:hypothetical protein